MRISDWSSRRVLFRSAVLRTDAPSGVAVSRSRAEEFAVLSAAYRAGVTVPEPLWLCEDLGVLGKAFYVMRRVGGTAAPQRLMKVAALGGRKSQRLNYSHKCASRMPSYDRKQELKNRGLA